MPKIVNHDERRQELIAATWRIIGRGGFEAATLKSIETEAGFSHGVVRHYFVSKDELLGQAFETAYEHTVVRAAAAIGSGAGLEALRKLCIELLPLDAERVTEAQVVVAFWDRAANNSALARIHREADERLQSAFARHLEEGRARGEVAADAPVQVIVTQLILLVYGAQVAAVLTPAQITPATQEAVLDLTLARARAAL